MTPSPSDHPENTPSPTTPGAAPQPPTGATSPEPTPSATTTAIPPAGEGYYYLDDQRTSHGPYTLSALQQMLADHLLQPYTLVSYKGATQWWTLEQICHGTSASFTGYTTIPAPTNAAQYSDSLGLIGVFKHVLFHKYFTIKGRATRREFWMFLLGYYLLMFLLAIIEGLLTQQANLTNLLSLFFIIPFITLFVRRLHDIGLSGWWYVLMLLACLPFLGIFIYIMVDFYQKLVATGALAAGISQNEEIEIIQTIVQGYVSDSTTKPLIIWTLLSLLLAILSNVASFICCLVDSQRGTNKYGPSYKYPETEPADIPSSNTPA